jgi:hypothetical protein
MFIAHDIAGWLGIPAGIVIAAMIILRRKGMAFRARRKQARAGQGPDQQGPDQQGPDQQGPDQQVLAGPGAGQETGRRT